MEDKIMSFREYLGTRKDRNDVDKNTIVDDYAEYFHNYKVREEAQKKFESTQEEIDAISFLDWSDERLGQFVKYTANYIKSKHINGFDECETLACCFLLVHQCVDTNADTITFQLDGTFKTDTPDKKSNWEIIVSKK